MNIGWLKIIGATFLRENIDVLQLQDKIQNIIIPCSVIHEQNSRSISFDQIARNVKSTAEYEFDQRLQRKK